MNKPTKPNIVIPESFAENGIKTDFDNEKLTNGFDRLQPDVLAGDNLNKLIDDTYKASNYALNLGDYVLGKNQITNCILEAPNGVATYSGTTITVKSGLKVLIPDGRNADGTLNNIEYTFTEDKTLTLSHNYADTFYLRINDSGNISYYGWSPMYLKYYADLPTPATGKWFYVYVEETNKFYASSNGAAYNEGSAITIGSFTTNASNVITDFRPDNTNSILKSSDARYISGWGMPSNKYINLTLGASGTSYTAPANGWFTIYARAKTSAKTYLRFRTSAISIESEMSSVGNSNTLLIPVLKGDKLYVDYTNISTPDLFRFIYAEGEV